MYRHIVFFRIKPECRDQIPALAEEIRGMADRIEGMTFIQAGEDFLHSGRSYDLALVADFQTRAAFDAYPDHPVHVPVKQKLVAASEGSAACDFEF